MLFERLIIDGNWIANGYLFKRVNLQRTAFMDLFRSWEAEAKTKLEPVSLTPKNVHGWDCLEFTDGKKSTFAQKVYFDEVGFDPEEDATEFTFKLNPDEHMIFVYANTLLIGGVMTIDSSEAEPEGTEPPF